MGSVGRHGAICDVDSATVTVAFLGSERAGLSLLIDRRSVRLACLLRAIELRRWIGCHEAGMLAICKPSEGKARDAGEGEPGHGHCQEERWEFVQDGVLAAGHESLNNESQRAQRDRRNQQDKSLSDANPPRRVNLFRAHGHLSVCMAIYVTIAAQDSRRRTRSLAPIRCSIPFNDLGMSSSIPIP